MPRYGVRFADSWIPTVEVTLAGRTVHRARGFTRSHAFKRALDWSREHGDPR